MRKSYIETPKDLFLKIIKNEYTKLKKEENTLFESIDTTINFDFHYENFKKKPGYYTYLHENTYEKIKIIKNYFYNDIMNPIMEAVTLETLNENLPISKQFLLENTLEVLKDKSGLSKNELNESEIKKKVNNINKKTPGKAYRYLNEVYSFMIKDKTQEEINIEETVNFLIYNQDNKVSQAILNNLKKNGLNEKYNQVLEENEIKVLNNDSIEYNSFELQESILKNAVSNLLKTTPDITPMYTIGAHYQNAAYSVKLLKDILGLGWGITVDAVVSTPIIGNFLNNMSYVDQKRRTLFKTLRPDTIYTEEFLREFGNTNFNQIGNMCWSKAMSKIVYSPDPRVNTYIYQNILNLKSAQNAFYNINQINDDEKVLINKVLERIKNDKNFNRQIHFYRKCFYGHIIDYIIGFTKSAIEIDKIEADLLKKVHSLKNNDMSFVKTFKDFYQFKSKNENEAVFKKAIISILDLKTIAIEMIEKSSLYRNQDIYMNEDGTFLLNKINQSLEDLDNAIQDLENGKPEQSVKYENLNQNNMKKIAYKSDDELDVAQQKRSIFDISDDDLDERPQRDNYNRDNRSQRDNGSQRDNHNTHNNYNNYNNYNNHNNKKQYF
jgi:hypothetical protein